MTSLDAAPPLVGSWYRRDDRPEPFQVVAYDRAADSIDVEYEDGTVDEWPLSHWYILSIESCDPPQDTTGPFDSVDGEAPPEVGPTVAVNELIEPIEAAQDEADARLLEAQAEDYVDARAPQPAPARTPRGGAKR